MTGRNCLLSILLAACTAVAGSDCWRPDPAPSKVVFVATQAGAPFEGLFKNFSGCVCLDPASPETGKIEITIDTAAVDTGIPEFDETLRGTDFFDTVRWPTARFASTGIRSMGDGKFSVRGQFTLRDITREIDVPFSMAPAADGGIRISGETTIKRLDYDIGLGEWRDTRWVGDEVVLRFNVALIPGCGSDKGVGATAPTPEYTGRFDGLAVTHQYLQIQR